MSEVVGGETAGVVPVLERLGAMEATLADFTAEMDVLRRIIRKEIKEARKEVQSGGDSKPAKKASKKKTKESSREATESTQARAEEEASPASTLAAGDYDAIALGIQVEALLRQQGEAQQRQLDDYCVAFGQKLDDEWKRRRKHDGEKRSLRIYQLERELVGLKENVLQTLVLDARKVELIHKRDRKIKELEEMLKREEEREQQLIAASKHKRHRTSPDGIPAASFSGRKTHQRHQDIHR